jgi:hypothetical protein
MADREISWPQAPNLRRGRTPAPRVVRDPPEPQPKVSFPRINT